MTLATKSIKESDNVSEIEQLEAEEKLKALQSERLLMVEQVNELQAKLATNKNKITNLKSMLFIKKAVEEKFEFKDREVTFSDHALLRYCERRLKIDFDYIKEKIEKNVKEYNKEFGYSGIIKTRAYRIVINHNHVSTII